MANCLPAKAPKNEEAKENPHPRFWFVAFSHSLLGYRSIRLTKKAEPPPIRDANRDSGTDSANGGWLRRLVRQHSHLDANIPSDKALLYASSV